MKSSLRLFSLHVFSVCVPSDLFTYNLEFLKLHNLIISSAMLHPNTDDFTVHFPPAHAEKPLVDTLTREIASKVSTTAHMLLLHKASAAVDNHSLYAKIF